jgi:hypothetical protein
MDDERLQLSENPVRGKQLPSLKLPAPMHTRRPPSRGRGRLHHTADSVVRQPHRHPCVVSLDVNGFGFKLSVGRTNRAQGGTRLQRGQAVGRGMPSGIVSISVLILCFSKVRLPEKEMQVPQELASLRDAASTRPRRSTSNMLVLR